MCHTELMLRPVSTDLNGNSWKWRVSSILRKERKSKEKLGKGVYSCSLELEVLWEI